MACGGFTCSKNCLVALNVLYIVVAIILIAVGIGGRTVNYVTSIKVVGGIIACGVFLLFIAILGILGAVKHNQVFLFFYMIVLFLLFLLQFGFACACLAVTESQRANLLEVGWGKADDAIKRTVQETYSCCGFDQESQYKNDTAGHPPCNDVPKCCQDPEDVTCCYNETASNCHCETCKKHLQDTFEHALQASGGVGLFFSFTELVGFIISFRYRRMAGDSHVTLQ